MRARNVLVVALVALAVTTAGCGSNKPNPKETSSAVTYTPIDDKTLYEQIAQLPGVTEVAIKYVDKFGSSNNYVGGVAVTADTDAADILDRVLAILRQGKPYADMSALGAAPEGGLLVWPSDAGLDGSKEGMLKRYGPQPGNGLPPGKTALPTQSPPAPIK